MIFLCLHFVCLLFFFTLLLRCSPRTWDRGTDLGEALKTAIAMDRNDVEALRTDDAGSLEEPPTNGGWLVVTGTWLDLSTFHENIGDEIPSQLT